MFFLSYFRLVVKKFFSKVIKWLSLCVTLDWLSTVSPIQDQHLIGKQPKSEILLVMPLHEIEYMRSEQSAICTEMERIQDVMGRKTIAPPSTAHMDQSGGMHMGEF